MPFDSFMTSALTWELEKELSGRKVDKICQPERDEVNLLFRFSGKNRLIINCTASTPYMALSADARENPATPPMLCMLLRKHLSRARIRREVIYAPVVFSAHSTWIQRFSVSLSRRLLR